MGGEREVMKKVTENEMSDAGDLAENSEWYLRHKQIFSKLQLYQIINE